MKIRITGTGSALPEKVVFNSDLEKLVDTSDEWIRERTGIQSRHISDNDTVSSLAAKACQRAISMAGSSPEEIDLILAATCSPEMFLPCCACQVQAELGAVNAVAFDINAACSGFLFGLDTARAYIAAGIYKKVLVVGSEVLSKLVDWTDRGTCVLFGDGAGAVLLEGFEEGRAGIISMASGCDGAKGMVLSCGARMMDAADRYIKMDGREVYKFATRTVPICIREALSKAELDAESIDLFILHQANIRIIETIAKKLDVDIEKFPVNLTKVGNMSSAAIPVLLDELNRVGRLKAGDKLVLSGFGAGLTYGACVIEW